MDERRAVPRQRTFFKGVLLFHSGNSSEDCLVRNLGPGGAHIELPHPNAPDPFELFISARGIRRPARAVWRNGSHIGVRFECEAPAHKPARAAADDGRY